MDSWKGKRRTSSKHKASDPGFRWVLIAGRAESCTFTPGLSRHGQGIGRVAPRKTHMFLCTTWSKCVRYLGVATSRQTALSAVVGWWVGVDERRRPVMVTTGDASDGGQQPPSSKLDVRTRREEGTAPSWENEDCGLCFLNGGNAISLMSIPNVRYFSNHHAASVKCPARRGVELMPEAKGQPLQPPQRLIS